MTPPDIGAAFTRLAGLTSIKRTRENDLTRAQINGNGDAAENIHALLVKIRKDIAELEKVIS